MLFGLLRKNRQCTPRQKELIVCSVELAEHLSLTSVIDFREKRIFIWPVSTRRVQAFCHRLMCTGMNTFTGSNQQTPCHARVWTARAERVGCHLFNAILLLHEWTRVWRRMVFTRQFVNAGYSCKIVNMMEVAEWRP